LTFFDARMTYIIKPTVELDKVIPSQRSQVRITNCNRRRQSIGLQTFDAKIVLGLLVKPITIAARQLVKVE
jgi:hypothetical protein